jgi:hypothetical protein
MQTKPAKTPAEDTDRRHRPGRGQTKSEPFMNSPFIAHTAPIRHNSQSADGTDNVVKNWRKSAEPQTKGD